MNVRVQNPQTGASAELDSRREHNPAQIVFRTQGPADVSAVQQLCAPGRTVQLVGRWDPHPHRFVIEHAPEAAPDPVTGAAASKADPRAEAAAAERARLLAMDEKDLRALAGERGVKWERGAAVETIVDRILEKAAAAAVVKA